MNVTDKFKGKQGRRNRSAGVWRAGLTTLLTAPALWPWGLASPLPPGSAAGAGGRGGGEEPVSRLQPLVLSVRLEPSSADQP